MRNFLLICADVELLYDVGMDSSLCYVDLCVLGPLGGVEFCQCHQMHRYNSRDQGSLFSPSAAVSQQSDSKNEAFINAG